MLVTGPTGCGKSSTLAALIDLINTQRRDHIVTIEDPVEYVHANRNSIVEQIEVGYDAPDFASSIRSILRQTPDVILVGEMRDPETISTALTIAETGHLVLFDAAHQRHLAGGFAHSRFVPLRQSAADPAAAFARSAGDCRAATGARGSVAGEIGAPGRYPAVEIMIATHGVRSLIRKGEDHQLYSAISTGRTAGMITMEQSLDGNGSGRAHHPGHRDRPLLPRGGPEAVSSGVRKMGTPLPVQRRRSVYFQQYFLARQAIVSSFFPSQIDRRSAPF